MMNIQGNPMVFAVAANLIGHPRGHIPCHVTMESIEIINILRSCRVDVKRQHVKQQQHLLHLLFHKLNTGFSGTARGVLWVPTSPFNNFSGCSTDCFSFILLCL
uniref:Uncharacterized protein n=1 Tax=Ciona intestinalis TaxID=7719 RepID=H2XKS0_CIOIN